MIPEKGMSTLLLFLCLCTYAQDDLKYNSLLIPSDLRENANSVIRKNDEFVSIESYDKMQYKLHRIITVFNKEGDKQIDAYAFYNNSTHIKKLEAIIYDQFGTQIKKVKSKDFRDVSAVDGGTLYSDNREKYLDYTPVSYPYTVEFFLEYSSKNTAGLSKWRPVEGYYVSVEESRITVNYSNEVGIHKKEDNFESYAIQNNSSDGFIEYVASNIPAISYEAYSPLLRNVTPVLKLATNKFYYEGYSSDNNDWNSLGKWMYNELIQSRLSLPQETKDEILKITSKAQTVKEKAKMVYEYVQENTRYISVQEGIGGIQPIAANEVDNLKYGDCKGLSNYTKALLDVVGIESNYARVYASQRKTVDVDKDFVSFVGQTNHAIINIPQDDGEDIWLECTSQTSPFGYTANFTDDRDVFLISPEGGKIVHTKAYKTRDNLLETTAKIKLNPTGGFSASVKLISKGTQYAQHEGIQREILKDQELHYKDYWSYINNLSLDQMNFTNNKDDIVFTESIQVSSPKYASQTSNLLLLEPNFFNRITSAPPRYRDRKLPFEIVRGFIDKDAYEIELPQGFVVDALQEPASIVNKFGEYHMSIEQKTPESLVYTRKFILNKGNYNKEDYKAFRKFWLQIIRHDKSKIVLKNTTKP